VVTGSTRFWNLERWNWPGGHRRHRRENYDACEIGYTWLTRSAVRTGANTEAKWLMLSHPFETWQVLRVCLHADVTNERSRAAIERLGPAALAGVGSPRFTRRILPILRAAEAVRG
jgi:N-acetyltransferase